MTEHEIVQNLLYMREITNSDTLDFITVLFAYAVLAHFVGASLSRIVAVTASALYSIYTLATLMSLAGLLRSQKMLGQRLHDLYPAASEYLPAYENVFLGGIILVVFPLGMGWLFSLYYMHIYIRRGNGESA